MSPCTLLLQYAAMSASIHVCKQELGSEKQKEERGPCLVDWERTSYCYIVVLGRTRLSNMEAWIMQGLGQVRPFAVQRMGMFAASWAGYCELLGSNSVFPWRVRLQETAKHQEVLLSWNQICLSDRVRRACQFSWTVVLRHVCTVVTPSQLQQPFHLHSPRTSNHRAEACRQREGMLKRDFLDENGGCTCPSVLEEVRNLSPRAGCLTGSIKIHGT